MKSKINILFFWLLSALMMAGCSKRYDKLLPVSPRLHNSNPGSAGSIRLFNFSQLPHTGGQPIVAPSDLDLSVNDRRLTVFSSVSGFSGPTLWFTTGRFSYGNSFTIPDSLFDAQGKGLLKFYYDYFRQRRPSDGGFNNESLDSLVLQMSIPVINDIAHPKDILFYDSLVTAPTGGGTVPVTALASLTVDRPANPPTKPDHFRIRLINLTGKPYADPTNQLTLTYADGSLVDAKTTKVGYPVASDYVDLPYGTYQFKIRDQSGNVLGLAGDIYGFGNQPLTYNPGGVYTLFAYNSTLRPSVSGPVYYNPSYVLQTDIKPSANPNYIRMQAIHAIPGEPNLHFSVDGQSLGGFLSFGQQTGYSVFSIGPHKLQLLDGNGKELASTVLKDTYPLDNLSVWAYPLNGIPKLLVTSNDLSQTYLTTDLLTGTNPNVPTGMLFTGLWKLRLLNLSDGVDYASFIDNTGNFNPGYNIKVSDSSAWLHLGVGMVPDGPGVVTGFTIQPAAATISAYAAMPGPAPGVSLNLTLDHPLVSDHYPSGKVPSTEMGTYTIALIGSRTGSGDTLRMITIKHNQ